MRRLAPLSLVVLLALGCEGERAPAVTDDAVADTRSDAVADGGADGGRDALGDALDAVADGGDALADGLVDGTVEAGDAASDAADAPTCDPATTCVGAPMPTWELEDFQPKSPGFEAKYGLSAFKPKVTVVALLAAW